jgi:hypothetical protein
MEEFGLEFTTVMYRVAERNVQLLESWGAMSLESGYPSPSESLEMIGDVVGLKNMK